MFWFDKKNQEVTFMDNRELDTTLSDGRKLIVTPDILADFRDMPFENDSFYLVVFDPPHLKTGGDKSWLIQKYGRLNKNWPEDLKQGFNECMRVLKPNGTLIFKWNEEQIKLSEVLKCFSQQPLFGNKRAKTHWLVFMKLEG
ncbi:class I SAM-dependent methyltransferase [Staphylococcus haemolyticus]|uniref:class I SAM-dependent methyltransferase n=1 Tax=Staphylococcus haemolyticus TaxID=1283 RepID=UPI002DB63FE3|nr:SAM-dependent methyltransferase [Staphylococcus haemolyticus]MEB6265021.1 class I SAM-dependent methyltransferase [Staphylococcus haemolyticus]